MTPITKIITLLTMISSTCFAGDLEITVKGIRNDKGNIALLVFTKADGFPDVVAQAQMQQLTAAKKGEVKLTLKNIPATPLAITVLHDEDKSGTMNKNFIGIPKEGVAMTGKPLGNKAPVFADAVVDLRAVKQLNLTLKYW